MLNKKTTKAYLAILKEELIPAMGCTEPIAIAYAAARLTALLQEAPTSIVAEVSGNIIKNVKSVIVPHTGGLHGIKAAIAAGVVAGDPNASLEVIAKVDERLYPKIQQYADTTPIKVVCIETPHLLDIKLTGTTDKHRAVIHIANNHTNVVLEQLDDTVVFEKACTDSPEDNLTDKSCLNIKDIIAFVDEVSPRLLEETVGRQIDYNCAIAEEGLRNSWGANIGSTIIDIHHDDLENEMRGWAAAGSDARMSGCELPVVILSGSGNQGMTASVPVVRLGIRLNKSREEILRAVALSDLVALEQKRGIGRLSAYCGAVSAGVGVGAATAYLCEGSSYDAIKHTIVNAVAIISGTICDGAKPSCAAKIDQSVSCGLIGYFMWRNHQEFKAGDGIVGDSVEQTIENVGKLASEGMRQTDRTILEIMTQE